MDLSRFLLTKSSPEFFLILVQVSAIYNTAMQCIGDSPKGHVVVTTESTVNSGDEFYKTSHNNN